jgi:hypothetical protein
MQAEPHAGMLEESLREGRVRLLVRFLDDVFEVSYWLMGMDY